MKIKTIENMAVIELGVTASELEKVIKYSPEALTIKNDDGICSIIPLLTLRFFE